jgi:hypothetical protein
MTSMISLRFARPIALFGLLLMLLPLAPTAAKEPITEWTHSFGIGGESGPTGIAIDTVGNVFITGGTREEGATRTGNSGEAAFVRQFHSDWSEGWTRQIATAGLVRITGVAVDAAGNVYVTGFTDGALPGQTTSGGLDAFVRRYRRDGSESWTHQFGAATDDAARGLALDEDGNVYIAGNTFSTVSDPSTASASDAFVRQYRPDGSEGWTRRFGTDTSVDAAAIAVDHAGNVYVAGSTRGTFPGQTSSGNDDAFVRQYSPNGFEGWTRQFGTPGKEPSLGAAASTAVHSIAVDPKGNVYVAGDTAGTLPGQTHPGGGPDGFVRQYMPDGNEGWTHQFGTAYSDFAHGIAIYADSIYVVGDTTLGVFPYQPDAQSGGVFVRQYDLDGLEGWTRQFGSTRTYSIAAGIAVDPTGNVYVALTAWGPLQGQSDIGAHDTFVVKLSPVDDSSRNPTTPLPPIDESSDRAYFSETHHSLAYGFKAFWERNGGLPAFGYPLTEEFTENDLTAQYLERQRLEWHPDESGTPYEIQLGLLGVTAARRQGLLVSASFQPLRASTQSDGDCTFVPETRHRLCFAFRDYWHSEGLDLGDPGISYRESLALFGYPISEEFTDPATGLTVQYFERAVFEYHPGNPEPDTVLLRRLGADELQARGW